jgi:hypothetical protein
MLLQHRQQTLLLRLLHGLVIRSNSSVVGRGITLGGITTAECLDSLVVDVSEALAGSFGGDALALEVQAVDTILTQLD